MSFDAETEFYFANNKFVPRINQQLKMLDKSTYVSGFSMATASPYFIDSVSDTCSRPRAKSIM